MQQIVVERAWRVVTRAVVLIAGHFGFSDAVLLHVAHAALSKCGYLLLALIDIAENGDSNTVDVNHDSASSEDSSIMTVSYTHLRAHET